MVQNSINEIFTWDNPCCNLMFSSDDELKDHCCIIQKKLSSLDNIKLQYVRIIQDVKYNKNQLSNKIVSEATTAISDAFQMNLKLGYAIKHRLNSRFSNKQKRIFRKNFYYRRKGFI